MKYIIAALCVFLVSAASAHPQRFPETQNGTVVDRLEKVLEELLDVMKSVLDLSQEQVDELDADMENLAADIDKLVYGNDSNVNDIIKAAEDLVKFIGDIIKIIGGSNYENPQRFPESKNGTLVDRIEKALEELLDAMKDALDLSQEQVDELDADMENLAADIDKFISGYESIITAFIKIAEDFIKFIKEIIQIIGGANYESPQRFLESKNDTVVDRLEKALEELLDLIKGAFNISQAHVDELDADMEKVAADIDKLIAGDETFLGVIKMVEDIIQFIIDIIRIISGADKEGSLHINKDDTMVDKLEKALEELLNVMKGAFNISQEQVDKLDADMEKLAADIDGLISGDESVAGIIKMVEDIVKFFTDIIKIIGDSGNKIVTPIDILEKAIEVLLEFFQKELHFSDEQLERLEADLEDLVKVLDQMMLGHEGWLDGLEEVVCDIIKIIADAFGLSVSVPPPIAKDGTPLDLLKILLDAAVEVFGSLLGLDDDQVKQVEEDLDKLFDVLDAMILGHEGWLDGLKEVIKDIIQLFADIFGNGGKFTEVYLSSTPWDVIERVLEISLQIFKGILGLTEDQVKQIDADLEDLVGVVDRLSMGQENWVDGFKEIFSDIAKILADIWGEGTKLSVTVNSKDDDTTILDLLEKIAEVILRVLKNVLGLSDEQLEDLDEDMEDLVHAIDEMLSGEVGVIEGILKIVDSLAKLLGDIWRVSDGRDGALLSSKDNGFLDILDKIAKAVLEVFKGILGLSDEQMDKLDADLDDLFDNIDKILSGEQGLLEGLAKILEDIIRFFTDLGGKYVADVQPRDIHMFIHNPVADAANKTTVDQIFETLEKVAEIVVNAIAKGFDVDDDSISEIDAYLKDMLYLGEQYENGDISLPRLILALIDDLLKIVLEFDI